MGWDIDTEYVTSVFTLSGGGSKVNYYHMIIEIIM